MESLNIIWCCLGIILFLLLIFNILYDIFYRTEPITVYTSKKKDIDKKKQKVNPRDLNELTWHEVKKIGKAVSEFIERQKWKEEAGNNHNEISSAKMIDDFDVRDFRDPMDQRENKHKRI